MQTSATGPTVRPGRADPRSRGTSLRSVAAIALVLLTGCRRHEDPERVIRGALEQWSRDWNAGDVAAVCALFSPDVVLSFPGTPDRDHAAMCRGFAATLARPDQRLRYDPPEIEEVLVEDDLAAVRLVWTLRVAADGPLRGEVVERERGVDVLQRQPDGSWKIRISHAYPDPPG